MDYRGFEVPVLDTLQLLGLGRLPQETAGPGVVLEYKTGYVVLAMSALLELTELTDDEINALPAFTTQRGDLLRGVSDLADGSLAMVIDGDALHGDVEVTAHAAVNTGEDESQQEQAAADVRAAGSNDAQLTYNLGFDTATPLQQIDEILPVPESITTMHNGDALVGIVSHRDGILPVVSLRTLLGMPNVELTSASCMLLVSSARGHVAFVVDGLRAIDTLAWEDPSTTGVEITSFADAIHRSPLIQVSAASTLIPQLDLVRLSHLLDPPVVAGTQTLEAELEADLSFDEWNEIQENA